MHEELIKKWGECLLKINNLEEKIVKIIDRYVYAKIYFNAKFL